MGERDIPSGRGESAAQANGSETPAGGEKAGEAKGPKEAIRFSAAIVWEGGERGSGEARVASGAVSIPVSGSRDLGGLGEGSNPEELLLAALGSCFVTTWAIFLKKLGLAYAEPSVRVSGELEKDPAGGFHLTKAFVHTRVPSSLLSERRKDVEKTLQLAEKYCIISKVVRAAMPLEASIEEV
jgi:peroxiredoxin-like protein